LCYLYVLRHGVKYCTKMTSPPEFLDLPAEPEPRNLAEVLATDPATVPAFRRQLGYVGLHLDAAGLGSVTPFIEIYTTMTDSVKGTLSEGPAEANHQFENPKRLAALTCEFGRLFFDALRGGLNGERVAPAWQHLFDLGDQRRTDAELAWQGVNAHILNDLAPAAYNTGFVPGSGQDYFMVNENIKDAANTLAARYVPGPSALKSGVAVVGNGVAVRMRARAWSDLVAMHGAADDPEAFQQAVLAREQMALRVSRQTAWAGSLAAGAAMMVGKGPVSRRQAA